MRLSPLVEIEPDLDNFDNVTEDEIISHWRSFKASGLSEGEAWHAIVAGIALDMAFERSRTLRVREQ